MRIDRGRLIATFANMFILLDIVANMFINWDKQVVIEKWTVSISIAAIALMVYQMLVIKLRKLKYTDFIPWFVALQFLFLYGRIFVYAIGENSSISWNLFYYFTNEQEYRAALFCLSYSQAIFTGIMAVNRTQISKVNYTHEYTSESVCFIGKALLLLSMPIKLYTNLVNIFAQRSLGKYTYEGSTNGFLNALAYGVVAGIILIISSRKLSRKSIMLLLTVFLLYEVLYMIFSGDRRQEITGIIAITLCYCYVNEIRIRPRNIIAIVTVAYVALVFLAAIRSGRQGVFYSLEDFIPWFEKALRNNLFVDVCGEFGNTFFTVVNGIKYYPDYFNYVWGLSGISTIVNIVPGLVKMLAPELYIQGAVNYRCELDNGLPTGGSLPQDMYCNFSFGGIAIAIVTGAIIAKYVFRETGKSTIVVGKYYILFYILLNLVRASINEVGRSIAYIFAAIYLLHAFWLSMTQRAGVRSTRTRWILKG